MSRKPSLALAAALVVYVAYRALVLATNFDAVSLPVYELYFGNIGKVLGDGWYGPPLSQYYDNCGGHLVLGVLSTPFFALFGSSYLALKLVPLTLGFLTLILVHRLTREEFGSRAAALAALFFAIGPPTLAKYSMLAKGNHFENLFFQVLMLWAFYRLHRTEPDSAARRRALWVLGISAGFAVFFYFGSLILLALLLTTHVLVRGLRGSLRDARQLIPASLVGLAPLIWIQLSGGSRPATFLGSHFVGEGGAREKHLDRVARVEDLLLDFLPRGTCFEDFAGVPGWVADRAYLALFLVAWVALTVPLLKTAWGALAELLRGEASLERQGQRFEELKALPLVGYLPAFILLYTVSRFEFDVYLPPVEVGQFRYLVPHYLFAGVVIALAAARWQAAQGSRALAGWALVGVMGATQLFSLNVIELGSGTSDQATRYPGYDFRYEKSVLLRDTIDDPRTGARTWDLALLEAQLAEFPRRERQESAFGVGHWRAWAQTMPAKPKVGGVAVEALRPPHVSLAELCAPHSEEVSIELARGAGAYLASSAGKPLTQHLPGLLEEAHPQLPQLIEGLCLRSEFPLSRNVREWLNQAETIGARVPEELRFAWLRGRGMACGQLLARGIEADERAVRLRLEQVPAGSSEFWFGLGCGLGEALTELDAPPDWLGALAKEQRLFVTRGLGAGLRHRLGVREAAPVFQRWRALLGEAESGSLELGLRWPNYPAPQRL